jgi:hypothetical protein
MMFLMHYAAPFLFFLLLFFAERIHGQVAATGHVAAEVVESVGASARVATGFNLGNDRNEELGTVKTSRLKLGTMTIHSGKNIACNVVIGTPRLTDGRGNGIEVETVIFSGKKKEASGTQILQLNADAQMRTGQPGGIYKGTYEMIFAYD